MQSSKVSPVSDESKMNCNADSTNSYYGNQGALLCLRDDGDVAILERQFLNGLSVHNNCFYLIFVF